MLYKIVVLIIRWIYWSIKVVIIWFNGGRCGLWNEYIIGWCGYFIIKCVIN